MSPYSNNSSNANEFCVYSTGYLGNGNVDNTTPGYRAVIKLNSDTLVTGQGTSTSPWVVQ